MLTSTQNFTPLPLPNRKNVHMTSTATVPETFLDLKKLFRPETPIESQLLAMPEFQEGMDWGKPRFGHPEGKVGLHVREVLDNIDRLNTTPTTRKQLRLLAIVHDVFKYREVKTFAEGKRIHHGKIAREFVTPLVPDRSILDIIELHDEAFYIWRQLELNNDQQQAVPRLHMLIERIGENLPLYFLFFKCDTQTGDKIQAPLHWFEATLRELGCPRMKRVLDSTQP